MLSLLVTLTLCFFLTADTQITSAQTSTPVPQLATWEQEMASFGTQHGAWFQSNWNTYVIGETPYAGSYYHYDAARVFMQIAKYTKRDEPWHTYAKAAADGWVRYVNEASGCGWLSCIHRRTY